MFEILASNLYGTASTIATAGWCHGLYGGRGFGMMGGYWPFGMAFMAIFWVAVIALAVWALWRLTGGRKAAPGATESHLDILKRRLAEGEITVDEFTKLKKTIDEKK
jgi:putative membrane protein